MPEVKVGRTYVVTGGASGLGEACTREFHRLGANVLICDMETDKGQALVKELKDRVLFVKTDVTDEKNVASALADAVQKFGGKKNRKRKNIEPPSPPFFCMHSYSVL